MPAKSDFYHVANCSYDLEILGHLKKRKASGNASELKILKAVPNKYHL